MSGGKHSSDEEFEFEINFELIRSGLLILVIFAIIAGVVFGTYKVVNKMKEAKVQTTSTEEVKKVETPKYPVLGKIKIDKIKIEQPILDSKKEEALKEGVIKLYGEDLNEERKFLYCRT